MATEIQCREIFGSYSNVKEKPEGPCPGEPCVPCQSKELCPPCPFRLTAEDCYSLKSSKNNKQFFEPLYNLQNKCIESNFKHKLGTNLVENLKWRCKSKKDIKQKNFEKIFLGCPIGVCFGELNLSLLKSEQTKEYDYLFGFGACILAFSELYITAEKAWDSSIINRILEDGKNLIENSLCYGEFLTEINVKKRFLVCGNTMEVHISEPIIIGRLLSKDIRIWNFRNSIEKCLRKHQHCLLTVGEYYFLIWINQGAIFIFDPYGRDIVLKQNLNSGYASLICVGKFKSLEYLIVEMSDLDYDEVFTLRTIKMVDLIPCCDKVEDIEHQMRKKDYLILNAYHACLRSHINVESAIFKEFRFKHSLAIVVTGIIFSKIDAPNTWDSNTLDRVIMMGNRFYKEWTNCNYDLIFNLENVPRNLKFGQFLVELTFCSMTENGLWKMIPNYRRTELTMSIKRAFQISSNLILQLRNRNYAIWKRADAYYIFDPYAHDCIHKDHFKVATLHMCNTIDMLCCILSQQIIEITDSIPYCIHIMFIRQIIKGKNLEQLRRSRKFNNTDLMSEFQEVSSLNESIVEDKCLEFDYEIKDFEKNESVIDLDSPTLSDTQTISSYKGIKSKIEAEDDIHPEDLDIDIEEEEEEEEKEEEEEEGEEEESGSEGDDERSFRRPSIRRKKPSKKQRDVERKDKKSSSKSKKKTEKGRKGRGVKEDESTGFQRRKRTKKKSRDGDETSESRSEDDVPKKGKARKKVDTKTKGKKKKGKGKEEKRDEDETSESRSDVNEVDAAKKGKAKKKRGVGEKKTKTKKAKDDEMSTESDVSDEIGKTKKTDDRKKIVKGKAKRDESKKGKSSKIPKDRKGKIDSDRTSTESIDESRTGKDKEKVKKSKSKKHKSKVTPEGKAEQTDYDSTSKEIADESQPKKDKKKFKKEIDSDEDQSDQSIEIEDKIKNKRIKARKKEESGTSFESDEKEKGGSGVFEEKMSKSSDKSGVDVKSRKSDKTRASETQSEMTRTSGISERTRKSKKSEKSKVSDRTLEREEFSLEQDDLSGEPNGSEKPSTTRSDEGVKAHKPDSYPGYSSKPRKIALVCTDADNESDLQEIFQNAFSNVDRIMIMTNQNNYVIFKRKNSYYLYEGCTCSIEMFKHIDISMGTAGLTYYENIDDLIDYILKNSLKYKSLNVDDICREYCGSDFLNSNGNGNLFKSYNEPYKSKSVNNKTLDSKKNLISLHCKNYNVRRVQCNDDNSYYKNFGLREHKIKTNFKNVVKDLCKILDNAFKRSSSTINT